MNDVKLKPCPCCGGEAIMQQTGRDKLKIQCKRCVIKMEQRCLRYSLEWLERRMIETWNTRDTPEGWQLVPVEPTAAMRDAGRLAILSIQGGYGGLSPWEAMLQAAPSPGQEE